MGWLQGLEPLVGESLRVNISGRLVSEEESFLRGMADLAEKMLPVSVCAGSYIAKNAIVGAI